MSAADIDAIKAYMDRTPAKNPGSSGIKAQFMAWYSGLGLIDKHLPASTEKARGLRDAFNFANAESQAELEHLKNIQQTGFKPPAEAIDQILNAPASLASAANTPGNTPLKKGVVPTTVKVQAVKATANAVSTTQPVLKLGTGMAPQKPSNAVKQWQAILGVKVDGKFGKDTETATRKWQKDHGLPETGVVDQKTWFAALKPVATPDSPNPLTPETQAAQQVIQTAVEAVLNKTEPPKTPPAPIPLPAGSGGNPVVPTTALATTTAGLMPNFGEIWNQIPLWMKAFAGVMTLGGSALVVVGAASSKRKKK